MLFTTFGVLLGGGIDALILDRRLNGDPIPVNAAPERIETRGFFGVDMICSI